MHEEDVATGVVEILVGELNPHEFAAPCDAAYLPPHQQLVERTFLPTVRARVQDFNALESPPGKVTLQPAAD
ncbi:hypothetical protein Cst04h_15890 [Corynebacterium striatum]|uniref:Uncharacterized protein n=1 Tax=Corynebacterium striatum TaxID=43770 RepID=A0ABC9ZMZ7_CORST|nr:hypothetical protein Cst04h_15890 [Corynebacterium striatum]